MSVFPYSVSWLRAALILLLTGGLSGVAAELVGEIRQGVTGAIPIAVVPFGGAQPSSENIAAIVARDLERTGRFHTLPAGDMLEQPTLPSQVRLSGWQALGQEYLVIGRIQPAGSGQFVAEFSLFDVVRGSSLLEYRLPFSSRDQRRTAHRIADLIYQKIIGEAAGLAAPVAFVTTTGGTRAEKRYVLQVADADGMEPETILRSREPIMSPAWSPDGKRIAYVSFENKTAAVFVQTLADGSREKVSGSPGINGAPAWSPDGRQLALTLSKDGDPDIYLMDIATRSLRRLTDHRGIDTEPNWSPDGRSIVFTSNRGGRPQLYLVSAAGGEAQRLTFQGDYNARGAFSPDGASIAMVHGVGGSYRIAVMDLASRSVRVISNGPLDESPGFSPDGRRVLFAARNAGIGQLIAVPVNGGPPEILNIGSIEVRQPAWSPKD